MSKEKRDRLFKSGRPQLRTIQIMDGDKYHKDVGYLWVAHKKRPFNLLRPNITQEEFCRSIEELSKSHELAFIEDRNMELGKQGPVGFICISGDWLIEPYGEFFSWATPKNILRCTVSFLQMIRYRKIGACLIKSSECSVSLLNKVCKYGVLHFVGKVPNGDPRGDLWLYSIRGKSERS